jgi:hypothetical protein
MDKTALGVIQEALHGVKVRIDGLEHEGDHCGIVTAVVENALGANGYVVVPRPEFEALADALDNAIFYPTIVQAARAVVEAVGPTPSV